MSAPSNVQPASRTESGAAAASQDEPVFTERTGAGRRKLTVNALRVAVLVVVLGGWQLATTVPIGAGGKTFADPFFFGAPSQIAERAYVWATEGTAIGPLWEQIYVTMEETVLGFVIGVVLGIVCGVTLGRNRLLADVFSPYIKAANSIPRVVLGSIFIIWLGLGLPSKVALAVVLVFFVVFFNAFQGVREVDRNLIANARILGASSRQLSTQVILPSAMTWIIASLHTSFGFALVGAVVGEFLGALKGLGLLIATAQGTFDPNGVFAAMFILAIVALIAEALVTLLENRLLNWRPQTATDIAGL